MTSVFSQAEVRHLTISAVVTRANGDVEDLGVISFRHSNRFLHHLGNLYIWIKERFRK